MTSVSFVKTTESYEVCRLGLERTETDQTVGTVRSCNCWLIFNIQKRICLMAVTLLTDVGLGLFLHEYLRMIQPPFIYRKGCNGCIMLLLKLVYFFLNSFFAETVNEDDF